MLRPVRTVAPTTTPVTLDQVKSSCGVDYSDDDDFLTLLIEGATAYLDGPDGILGYALVTQTWRQDYDGFDDELRLPLRPVSSITSVTYYDADNTQQTLATSVYELLTDAEGSYVTLKTGQSWPSVYDRTVAVSVTFVAGLAAGSIPAGLKNAILMLVRYWYDNRATASGQTMTEIPFSVDALIRPYRKICL